MPKLKRAALFCCILFVAAAVLWPGLWNQPLQHQQISQWIRGKKLAYQGTLQVWYIPGHASGTGDGSKWAKARLDKFEKNNFGIFYEMQILDTQGMQAKLSAGQRPDLVFFGSEQADVVVPLLQQCEQTAKLAPAWQDKTVEQLAWPVFYSGYAILVNEQALYSVGLSPPLDIEDMDQAYLQQVQQALPNAFAYETKQAGLAAMGAQMNEQTRQAIVQGGSGTRAQFLKEEIAFFACPASTWYTIEGLSNTQSVPSYQAVPLSNLAVEAQYVGVMKTEDQAKTKACNAAVACLLSQNSQQALEDIGALPVIWTDEPMQAQGSITGALWQHREEKNMRVLDKAESIETFFATLQASGFDDAAQWLRTACNTP